MTFSQILDLLDSYPIVSTEFADVVLEATENAPLSLRGLRSELVYRCDLENIPMDHRYLGHFVGTYMFLHDIGGLPESEE